MDELKITRRKLPHWELNGSVYFVTIRILTGSFTNTERCIVLDHLLRNEPRFYTLYAAVVMPDHAHIILKPTDNISLGRIIGGIKVVSARKINKIRSTGGSIWQPEWFDRILRDENELSQKSNYMLNNPVKAELVEDGWDYEWWYISDEMYQ